MLIFIKNFAMKIQQLFIILLFILNIYNFCYTQHTIEQAKNSFISNPNVKNASIGICVYDILTNEKISYHNENIALPSASTVKLFATASAIEILGKDYRPKTRIYSENKIDHLGHLNGNLWIRGGGDVSLGSRYYNKSNEEDSFLYQWADTLYAMGIRKIHGDIIGDASEFGYQGAPDGWNWGDMGNYYGSGPSGLPIYDNILRFYFNVSKSIGVKASLIKTFPEILNLNFNNYIYSSNTNGDNSYIYGAPYSYDRFSTGYLPKNSNSFVVKGSLPDSEMQFVTEFKRILALKGIFVEGKCLGVRNMNLPLAEIRYKSLYLIYSNLGRDLKSIAKWTNLKSVNLFAEQLICWIAYEMRGIGDTKTGTDYIEYYWKSKINTSGLNLKDGSGLSRSNAVTAENFCSLLNYMYKSSNQNDFIETLAVAGESGTLSSLCKGQIAQGKVKAKSGTMNKIKSYSGYVETLSGKKLSFAIIVNNYSCSTETITNNIADFMNEMVKY
jgi:D-alanyl-D-alanine carboxypeptidase/D-alanyl-D-alanine-endopeptidase (penicillin-binding protein 4)